MDKEADSVFSAIEKLCADIGKERAIRVLEFALPRVIGFERDIRESMLAGEHAAATNYAHRAISSVRAYGTEHLEILLRQACTEGHDLQQLQPVLSREFTLVIERMDSWLQANSNSGN